MRTRVCDHCHRPILRERDVLRLFLHRSFSIRPFHKGEFCSLACISEDVAGQSRQAGEPAIETKGTVVRPVNPSSN